MIRNFEEYTSELTDDERVYIIPRLVRILTLAIGKEKSVTNKTIIKDINVDHPIEDIDAMSGKRKWIKAYEPRIRHMIHILRVSDTIPFLVANSAGYYISNNKEEIETYIGSIEDRLRSIYDIRRALKRQTKEWGRNPDAIQRMLNLF